MFVDMLAIEIHMAAIPLGITMNPAGGFCEKYDGIGKNSHRGVVGAASQGSMFLQSQART